MAATDGGIGAKDSESKSLEWLENFDQESFFGTPIPGIRIAITRARMNRGESGRSCGACDPCFCLLQHIVVTRLADAGNPTAQNEKRRPEERRA